MTLDDFADFKAEELKTAFKNARYGISETSRIDAVPVVIENGVAFSPAVLAIPAVPDVHTVLISEKSTSRSVVSSLAYHYYRNT